MGGQLSCYILFQSHTDGLALEKILKSERIKYTIVPTPRELSKSCGITIMINPDDEEKVREILDINPEIKVNGIHTIERKRRGWF
ncbi:DUF3343 domain-containing protein [Caloranaerobacter ferrireducens]|uniref:DUF3343 domain-containing protein n=1 Tax=Caloranaerobacter ferrireducens TaxID=1323370 RepID=UPI00084DFFED|nr:DUF3343 domain-containing protein [Caloranaerobacter ferrireducens]